MTVSSSNPTALESMPDNLTAAQETIRELRQALQETRYQLDQTRKDERCFRQLAEHIREVFWMTNPLGDALVYISPAYEHIWGQTCQSLYEDPGKRLAWVHDADRERVLTAFKRDARDGEYDETFRIDRPDGEIRWIRDRAFPILDDDGEVYRLAGFAVDVTQTVDQQDRVSRLGDALARKERTSVFAALGTGLAHDISQPLTAARNLVAQALQPPNDQSAERQQTLAQADQEIQRAITIVRHLRDFAQEGKPTLTQQPLAPILDDVWQLFDSQLRAKQIDYVPPTGAVLSGLEISIDRVFTQQILRNLIANAVDASNAHEDRSEKAKVVLDVDDSHDQHIDITVSDNGRGISDDIELFEPFATTKTEGLGLGLSVSRSLAESHGGTLTLKSRGNPGMTAFVLRLPRTTPPAH